MEKFLIKNQEMFPEGIVRLGIVDPESSRIRKKGSGPGRARGGSDPMSQAIPGRRRSEKSHPRALPTPVTFRHAALPGACRARAWPFIETG
jgi:hypothetical protein